MILIRKSPTADSRTCDVTQVTKDDLLTASKQHIADVDGAMAFFMDQLRLAAWRHDADKLTDIDGFYANFREKFAPGHRDWLDRHVRQNRHHLNTPEGVPEDVTLIDVLDMIADCVVAGMARSGEVYPLTIDAMVLARAFQNTVNLLRNEVRLVEADHAPA